MRNLATTRGTSSVADELSVDHPGELTEILRQNQAEHRHDEVYWDRSVQRWRMGVPIALQPLFHHIQTQIVRNGRIEVHHIIRHKDIAGADVNALEAASQIVSVANVRSGVTHQRL